MDPVRVAFDVGPLHGHRTGVGAAVAELAAALDAPRRRRRSTPYVLSFRARPRAGRAPAADARRRRPPPVGASSIARGSTAGSAAPTSSTARTTSCRRAAGRAVVSVYDCWFLRHPEPGRAGRRAAPAPSCAARVARRRDVHASSQATADVGSRAARHRPGRGRPPRPARRSPRAAGADRRRWADSRSARSCSPSARSSGARTCPASSPRSAAVAGGPTTPSLVIAGAPGDDSAAVDAAVDAPRRRRPARGSCGRDRSTTPTKAWLLHHARVLAYPSLDEGFGFPILEAQAVGLPVVATRAGLDPRGRRRRRRAGRRSATATRSPRPCCASLDDDDRRPSSIAAGHAQRRPGSRGRAHRPSAHGRRSYRRAASSERADVTDRPDVDRGLRRRRRRPLPARALQRRRAAGAHHRRRQHRRRHRAARAVDLPRPRHDHLHARRRHRPGARLGPRRRDVATRWTPSPATSRCARPARRRRTTWFNLGDRDLATHLYRTARLAEGATLDRRSPTRSAGPGASTSRCCR